MPKLFLPLFLLAAIGLTVYLAQQQTELTPSAAEVPTTAPTGCKKVTPGTRSVQYKACQDAGKDCGTVTPLTVSPGENDKDPNYKFPPGNGVLVGGYPLKESVWDFGGWKLYNMKGPRQGDGERTTISKGRFDSPDGKSYEETDDDPISANGTTRDGNKIEYGSGVVVEFAYTRDGTNYQGLPGKTYDASKSYAFVPSDPNSSIKCNGTGTTGTGKTDDACSKAADCKSGVCTNKKCAAQGNKAGGDACTDGVECQSGKCSNNKCEGGSRSNGSACDKNSDCASNKCDTNNKCVSATASASPSKSASPKSSSGNNGSASTAPGASVSPSSSPLPSASAGSPAPSASAGGTTPTSLTKAEITGFKNSYDLLNARLGTASNSGNLKITATIARNELSSIVSELTTCPDDANVGTCLDSKFRTRFDFAKTAARLSAFYAIFNNISGICVKADLGLNPLLTATSVSNTTGRVNLCTEPTAARKLWRAFVGGQFVEILGTDTRWPANPTCATLPADVLERYRRGERLFSSQSGFVSNTLCDGKTSVAPGDTQ